jgi:hypothetical protein
MYTVSTGQWVWLSGSSYGGAAGYASSSYGTLGVESTTSCPSPRASANQMVIDSNAKYIYLHSGYGNSDTSGTLAYMTDL